MTKQAAGLDLTRPQRQELEGLVRKGSTAQQVVLRARIVLMAAQGHSNSEIARTLDTSRPTVLLWRRRFEEEGVDGLLHNAPGQGRPRTLKAKKEEQVIQVTLTTKPKAATHWSTRTLARAMGLSKSMVWRLWRQHDLQPHRVTTFKQSRDPQFIEKLHDVVGLYLNPPEKALVLAVDEKSQIQALERSQPLLPLRSGLPESRTHDYKRHGTTTLFAALNVLDGKVIGQCLSRHRHQEFLKFLQTIDQQTPPQRELHLIVDNYSSHKHAQVNRWLRRHPRFHLHFTPTSCSWLNLVESWFSQLTTKRLRRDSFPSVPKLIQTINAYIAANNQQPKPFVWTATPQAILSVGRDRPSCLVPRTKQKSAAPLHSWVHSEMCGDTSGGGANRLWLWGECDDSVVARSQRLSRCTPEVRSSPVPRVCSKVCGATRFEPASTHCGMHALLDTFARSSYCTKRMLPPNQEFGPSSRVRLREHDAAFRLALWIKVCGLWPTQQVPQVSRRWICGVQIIVQPLP